MFNQIASIPLYFNFFIFTIISFFPFKFSYFHDYFFLSFSHFPPISNPKPRLLLIFFAHISLFFFVIIFLFSLSFILLFFPSFFESKPASLWLATPNMIMILMNHLINPIILNTIFLQVSLKIK